MLGSYRSGEVFMWDEDGDFGVLKEDYERFYNVSKSGLFRQLAEENPEYHGFDIVVNGQSGLFARVIDVKSKSYVDLFLYEYNERNGNVQMPAYAGLCVGCIKRKDGGGQRFSLSKDVVFPLQNCTMEGKQTLCPKDQKHYLLYIFGDNLRPPIEYRSLYKFFIYCLCILSSMCSVVLIQRLSLFL